MAILRGPRRKDDPWDLAEEMDKPPDARDGEVLPVESLPFRLLMTPRCTWCGREVREDWTPEDSDAEHLCVRCREMVRDPDTLKSGGAA